MKKRKILLVNPPFPGDLGILTVPPWRIHRPVPYGLLSIASYLDHHGHQVRLVDCLERVYSCATTNYCATVLHEIERFSPDVVGIGILTSSFTTSKALANAVRRHFPHVTLIVGGVHPSTEPALTFEQIPEIDAICIGAGEEVCKDIAGGESLDLIPGLMLRELTGKYTSRQVMREIDHYPFPNYELLNCSFYTAANTATFYGWMISSIQAMTSRSCPFSCKFCAAEWSKPYTEHSPAYVVGMLNDLRRYGTDSIIIIDDTLASNPKRLRTICEKLLETKSFHPHGRQHWRCLIRATQAKPELLQLMKSAGCMSVGIGMESGSNRLLLAADKHSSSEMNRQAAAYIKEAGLNLTASFIVGLPGEREEDTRLTRQLIQDIDCSVCGVGSFRPLPGSPYYGELFTTEQDKANLDWDNLGDFSAVPAANICFADMTHDVLVRELQASQALASDGQYVSVRRLDAHKYKSALLEHLAICDGVRVAMDGGFWSPRDHTDVIRGWSTLPRQRLNALCETDGNGNGADPPPASADAFTARGWAMTGESLHEVDLTRARVHNGTEIETTTPLVFTTPTHQWAYAVTVPIDLTETKPEGILVRVSLTVEAGIVGIGCLEAMGSFAVERLAMPAGQTSCVDLVLGQPERCRLLVVRSVAPTGMTSRVSIDRVEVLGLRRMDG